MATKQKRTEDQKKLAQINPFAVALGAADRYVEWLRHSPLPTADDAKAAAPNSGMEAVGLVLSIPRRTVEQTTEYLHGAARGYRLLGARGEGVAAGLARNPQVRSVTDAAGQAVRSGKGAVTPFRKALVEIRDSSERTVTASLRRGGTAMEAGVGALRKQADHDVEVLREAGKRSVSRLKAARTSARKAATAAAHVAD